MDNSANLIWLFPWVSVQRAELVSELQREVGTNHPLYQQRARAIGQRCDGDDVLFHVPDCTLPYAVVHLTWSGRTEPDDWPATTFYASLEDWQIRCMRADHQATDADS
jgi:hypothetical protein